MVMEYCTAAGCYPAGPDDEALDGGGGAAADDPVMMKMFSSSRRQQQEEKPRRVHVLDFSTEGMRLSHSSTASTASTRPALPLWWRILAVHSHVVHFLVYVVTLRWMRIRTMIPPLLERERAVRLTNEDVAAVLGDVKWELSLDQPLSKQQLIDAIKKALSDMPHFAGRLEERRGHWYLVYTKTPRYAQVEPLFAKYGGVNIRSKTSKKHNKKTAADRVEGQLRTIGATAAYVTTRMGGVIMALWARQLLYKRVLTVELEDDGADRVTCLKLTWSHALGDAGCFSRFVDLIGAYYSIDDSAVMLPAPPLASLEARAALARRLLEAPAPRASPALAPSANGNFWVDAAQCAEAAPGARLVDAAVAMVAHACGARDVRMMRDMRTSLDGFAGVTGNLLRFGRERLLGVCDIAAVAELLREHRHDDTRRGGDDDDDDDGGVDFRTSLWAGRHGGPSLVVNDLSGVAVAWSFGVDRAVLSRCLFGGAMRVAASEAPRPLTLVAFDANALARVRGARMVTLMVKEVEDRGVVVTLGAQAIQGQ